MGLAISHGNCWGMLYKTYYPTTKDTFSIIKNNVFGMHVLAFIYIDNKLKVKVLGQKLYQYIKLPP